MGRQRPEPHVVIVNRWRERYAEYDRYLDHRAARVSYVSTEVGLGSVPPTAADVRIVDATDDLPAVRAAVRGLATRHGAPRRIVALKEDDLLVGAKLREEWGCPGPTPAELLPWRDKFVMSTRVAAAGLPTRPFAPAPDAGAVRDFARRHGWPVIVKPRVGSASAGVARLSGGTDLARVRFDQDALLVQAYDPDPVYHVDGLLGRGGLVRWRAARYLNTCLDFRLGDFLGSVEEDDPELNGMLGRSAERFLLALGGAPTVFHLEVFVHRRAGAPSSCTFLEAGARVGGGETALLWRELHGFDLMEQAFRIQCGQTVEERPEAAGAPTEYGGHLLVPAPARRPCRITGITSMLGRRPGPYAEALPRTGDVVPPADSFYEHVGGRFRFRGASSRAVVDGITRTVADFSVSAEPVADLSEAAVGALGGS